MELDGPWEAVVADDDVRRTWLDDVDPDPATVVDGPDPDLDAEVPDWQPIRVPGHWRSTPAFADTDGPLLYRLRFEHPVPEPGERFWLRLDGIFYQGDVWLDGGYVGDPEGYFFPHKFEITEALAARTDHLLGIEVTCSAQRDLKAKRNITGVFQHDDSLDPTANPGGLWRRVSIERTGPIRIRHLRVVCREANETRATVRFRAVLDAAEATDVTLRSSVGDTEVDDVRRLAAGENQVEWQVRVDEPELWWPHALGDQPLHDVVVEVVPHLADETDEGEQEEDLAAELGPVSHRVVRRIGLRQVHLRGWVLHVNGERLFTKGVNVGPTRFDLAEATGEDIARDVRLAREANLDLLRVRGHIARKELYDAADEAGMLVWQDFPLQWGYARTIRKQAVHQAREAVDLLGHHPSIAVWCAHNDPEQIGAGPGAAGVGNEGGRSTARFVVRQELPSWNRTILDRSVKRALDKADGSRPVVPHSGVLPHPPMLDGTDSHLGFGWYHGDARELAGFARAMPRMVRFVTEMGARSVPENAEFCDPASWPDLDWAHLEAAHGLEREVFDERVPPVDHPTFDSWRAATQAYQAAVVRRQVETLRRIKYRPTGGFAVRMLADAQPAVSWSLLDHERVPKAAWATFVEVCRPVIVTADHLPDELVAGSTLAVDVHVVSDLRTPIDDVEVTAVLRWGRDEEQRWRFGGTIDADRCLRVGTLPIEVPDVPGPMTLDLELRGDDVPGGPLTRTDVTRIVRR
ncbi:MAG: hypothetical protein KF906_03295 [Actinobacteria bacterium]|nr:hypothetical protein [Actinomycetota bacterium]